MCNHPYKLSELYVWVKLKSLSSGTFKRYNQGMANRRIKQLFYGLFYLLILALIAGGVYLSVRPAPSCSDGKLNQAEVGIDCGGPACLPCAIGRLKPIKALPPQFFGLDGTVTALLEFQNPNSGYGAKSFRYELTLYDRAGSPLKTIGDSSFIYAAEIKTIVLPALEIDMRLVARGEVGIRDPLWEEAGKFPKPPVETREVTTREEMSGIAVQGLARNSNPFGLSRLNIFAVVADNSGLFINGSRTFVADLKPFEERFFKITIPIRSGEISSVDFKRTRIFVEVIR